MFPSFREVITLPSTCSNLFRANPYYDYFDKWPNDSPTSSVVVPDDALNEMSMIGGLVGDPLPHQFVKSCAFLI